MNEPNLQDVYTLQIRRQANQKGASPYCTACKDGFLHVNSLQVRQFTETGKLPGVCKACNNAFLRICRLQIRHLTQTEHHPHVCTICNKTFTHAGNFKKHRLLHERENSELKDGVPVKKEPAVVPKPPFHCEKCGRSFLKYGSFQKHCENHNNVQSFICNFCDKNCKTKPLLKSHLKVHQVSDVASNSQVCKMCKKVFAVPEELAEHLLEHVNGPSVETKTEQVEPKAESAQDDKYKHYCSVCQKGFVNLGALKNHFSLHTGNLAFECRKCKRRFMHAFNLKKHAKIHARKTYSCKKCDKVYKSRKLMKKHSMSHNDK